MTARLTTALTRIALVVLILDSLYLLFMFLVFPLQRAKGFPAFFREAAQGFGVSQSGFAAHWAFGLAASVAVLVCATASLSHFSPTRVPLILACSMMLAFTIASGLYLRDHLGLRHAWRIGICAMSIIVFLIAKPDSGKGKEPNTPSQGMPRPAREP